MTNDHQVFAYIADHNSYGTTGCRLATRSHSQLAYVIYFYALAA
ncbi:hypothetical protein [Nostoc sp. NMS4]|nr:hypothetical protein [Nostoc sp. NMS4]